MKGADRMIEEIIFESYGIHPEREEALGKYPSFISGPTIYSIIPLGEVNQEELKERKMMADQLVNQGDRYIAEFVMANHGSYVSEAEEQPFVLVAARTLHEPRSHQIGRKVAKFHYRARGIPAPIKVCSRIGQWKELWEQRIDQLEQIWNEKLKAHPNNPFEEAFIATFPYYMALGETSIQYLVDTEMDDTPTASDSGTVCYDRFTSETWNGKYCIKNPFDWIFDHGSRDVAEWIRHHYLQNQHTYQPGISTFMSDYQTIGPLSSFSARLLYSRLMFPIHYYEVVEEYFSSPKEARANELEEQIQNMANTSTYYEEFLRRFYEIAHIPSKQLRLPDVNWL